MTAAVRRHREDAQPAAIVVSEVHVGAVVQLPMAFWALVLGWPIVSARQRCALLVAALPMSLLLESITTVYQLVSPFDYASRVLSGAEDPVTLWERWSRFLEAGGRLALALGGGLLLVAVVGAHDRESRRPHPVVVGP
jgi:hypothetical protein